MRRLRSSSMALSRAMLSDSLSRSCATTSAAARGASEAVCTRREISAMVLRACASACAEIWPALRSSDAAMAASVSVQAASRCASRDASSVCRPAWLCSSVRSSAADCWSKCAAAAACACCVCCSAPSSRAPMSSSSAVERCSTLRLKPSSAAPRRCASASSCCCTVPAMWPCSAAVSLAMPLIVRSTTGWMVLATMRALSARLWRSDSSTDAARPR